jgi:hypothetical protein
MIIYQAMRVLEGRPRGERHRRIELGPVHGLAGQVVRKATRVGHLFKGEKIVADDHDEGRATLVRQLYVDGVPVWRRPPDHPWYRRLWAWVRRRELLPIGINTFTFAATSLGSGLSLPAAASEIAVEIVFVSTGTWRGWIWGRVADMAA